jgi:TolB protein
MLAAAAMAAAAGAAGLAGPALVAQASPAASVLAGGQAGSRAEVPWSKVGPGWALAFYSAAQGGEGIKFKPGAATLYLVDPRGGRYSLARFAARSASSQWFLQAWSGDKSRALFTSAPEYGNTVPEHVYQLQLRSGAITSFTLPAGVNVVGYTRPEGANILTAKWNSRQTKITLQRYSLTGQLQKTLATVRTYTSQVSYQQAGGQLAAPGLRGLELVSNQGGIIRSLPVPGVRAGCGAVRWWNSGTILATCTSSPNSPEARMWLVPADGARPTALTPARGNSGFDYGDFNAWQLSSGLYVDGVGACGTVVIGRQPAHGPEQQVSVPGSPSSLVVNATRSALMVERDNGCSPGISLVWFNPATRAMTVALAVSHHEYGVQAVVPYFIAGRF